MRNWFLFGVDFLPNMAFEQMFALRAGNITLL